MMSETRDQQKGRAFPRLREGLGSATVLGSQAAARPKRLITSDRST